MLKKNKELIIAELKNAKLQEDGSIQVTIKYDDYVQQGTVNYGDFRRFCEELIRKIRIG